MSIAERYAEKVAASGPLYERAAKVMADGLTHEVYCMTPFPPYITRASGSHKWDVDGNEYVDYWMGHGSLLLGHGHPRVLESLRLQTERGAHYGASYAEEVEWAELVTKMVPSAEMVRFTCSGTESVMLAIKLARAFTGKDKVVKLEGAFHGWSDYAQVGGGLMPPYDMPVRGVPGEVQDTVLLAPPNDAERVLDLLRKHDDVACVLVEPGGPLVSRGPSSKHYLEALREITEKYGVLLVFDEVVTGFRYAPGGCQQYWGVSPDLTTLGKIIGGGMAGAGAVAGRRTVMSFLCRKGDPEWDRYRRVEHHGTFNASPHTCAAGLATLKVIQQGEVIPRAHLLGDALRKRLNEVFSAYKVRCCVYGRASLVLPLLNHNCALAESCERISCTYDYREINRFDPGVNLALRQAMILNGVDLLPLALFVSAAHTEEDIERTVIAWDAAVSSMKEEGILIVY